MRASVISSKPPQCCAYCRHLDWSDSFDGGGDYYFCGRGLIFPTKKQTCAVRDKDRKEVSHG